MGQTRDPLDGRDDFARTDRIDDARHDTRDEISSEQNTGLRALSDLDDLAITDGEPDIRGWTVRTTDGAEVGEVEDLIIDTTAMKVRYMCVELDKDAFDLDDNRRVLVPIGTARLDDDVDAVFINSTTSQLLALPAYDDDAFSGDSRASHELFGRPWATGQTASADDNRINSLDSRDLYQQDAYNDRDFFGSRRSESQDQSYLRRHENELRLGNRAADVGDVSVPRRIEDERNTAADLRRDRLDVDDATRSTHRATGNAQGDELR